MRPSLPSITGLIVLVAAAMACNGSEGSSISPTAPTSVTATTPTTPEPTPTPTAPTGTQTIYGQFASGVTVTFEGTSVVLRTTDVPDHASPYWGAGHALYEAPHAGMLINPHRIVAQNLTFRVPLSPASTTASDTPGGPIGLSVNGVVLFNQYAAMRQPLTSEVISFDRFNGHPSPNNQYHYHFEPVSLTAANRSRLIGVLLDGFPVYGPIDSDGRAPGDLDSCNGHVAGTPEFASGIYHYHTTTAVPYISGCFRGAPGTVQ